MKWFKHDSDAHTDAKLKRVRHKYGIVGYGLYWYCVELIAGKIDKQNITFELEEDAELIAVEWNLDQIKVEEIMRFFVDIRLFECENSVITCFKLAKRLDDTNAKNPQIKSILGRLFPSDSESVGESPNNSGQNRLEENRKEKDSKGKSSRFVPPTLQEVTDYVREKNYTVDPERFVNHYETNGWRVGKNKMVSWKHAVANWQKSEPKKQPEGGIDYE